MLTLFQIIIAFGILSVCLMMMFDVLKFNTKLDKLENIENIYYMNDVTDQIQLNNEVLDTSAGLKNMQTFYEYLHNNQDFQAFTQYSMLFASASVHVPKAALWTEEEGGFKESYYDILYVDPTFLSVFGLSAGEGRDFELQDFGGTNQGEVIPVILGSEFSGTLSIGEIINEKYEIIGFWPDKSYFLNPKSSGDLLYLDKYIVAPINMSLNNTSSDYDSAINGTCIITNNAGYLSDIQSKSSQLNLFTYRFFSFRQQLDRITQIVIDQLSAIQIFLALILMFTCVGIVTNILRFIETHQKEFAIHMLCGARDSAFIYRIIFQVVSLFGVSAVTLSILVQRTDVSIALIFIALLLSVFVLCVPIIKIKNTSVTQLIKRSE